MAAREGKGGGFSLVLFHRLFSGPSVQGGTFHGALCGRFSRTAGGSESYVLPGGVCAFIYATAAAAATAADWVTVAFLTVSAGLGAFQGAGGRLLLRLIHVTAVFLGAARRLPLSRLGCVTRARAHVSLGAACRFCGGGGRRVF